MQNAVVALHGHRYFMAAGAIEIEKTVMKDDK